MNKKLIVFTILFFMTVNIHAQLTWNIQGNIHNVDTLYHATVGPGTTLTSLMLTGKSKQRVFYQTIDLANPNVDIKVVVAKDKVIGVDNTVRDMAISHSQVGSVCFAGVNGDFYAQKVPIGINVVNGEIFNTPVTDVWHQFGLNSDKVPYLGSSTITGMVNSKKGNTQLYSINMLRDDAPLTIFTDRYNTAQKSGGYASTTE
ncbi:MAG: hypothetical protein RR706_07855, partial [Muribaculaceae bacterium]